MAALPPVAQECMSFGLNACNGQGEDDEFNTKIQPSRRVLYLCD